MNKMLFLSFGVAFILSACDKPKKVPQVVVDPNPAPLEKIDETIRPANPVPPVVLAQWKNLAAKNTALIPATEAYFSSAFYQGTLITVSPDESRKATERLSAEGKKNLSYAFRRCQLQAPYATTSSLDGALVVSGITSVSGDYCLLSMNETHQVSKKVISKTNETETYSSRTQSEHSLIIKDANLKSAAGVLNSTRTLQVSGTYLRYLKSPYAYSSAQVKVTGVFSLTLSNGDIVSGTLKGDATLGTNASTIYLLEATTAKGDIRLITKRTGNQIRYILNGVDADASVIPPFLHLTQEY